MASLDDFVSDSEALRESYARMADVLLSIEDQGWSLLGLESGGVDAFSLEALHSLSAQLFEKTDGNPLLKRGLGLRSSYVFGRGVEFQNVSSERVKGLIAHPQNQAALFSIEAFSINERSNFCSGQFFVLGDNSSKLLQRIPFNEITGWVTDPDNAEVLRFVRRSWSRLGVNGQKSPMHEWYAVDSFDGPFPASIQGQPVNRSKTMFPFMVNRRAGTVWGVPDALTAFPWAHAYNEYLKDGSRILKSLSMFAWKLQAKTKSGAQAAAATIATPQTAGSTAILGADMDLSAMPRAGAGADLSFGKPLAAMVASALEVSVVALLSDPGTSGAYGVAQTLDVPTTKAMQARQRLWEDYLKRVLKFFGDRKADVKWPKMESESSFRQLQSLALSYEAGALWDDEFRNAVLDELDVVALHTETRNDAGQMSSGSVVPAQGQSGAVGSMQDNSNDLRDMS